MIYKYLTLSILGTLILVSSNVNAQNNLSSTKTITIGPGQQTSEANLKHQKFCQSIGGTDITNSSTITLTGDTQDAIECSIPENSSVKAGVTPVDTNGNLGTFSTQEYLQQLIPQNVIGLIALVPPSGTLPYNTQSYVTGYAKYRALSAPMPIRTTLSVAADRCSASSQLTLPPQAYKQDTLTIMCRALVIGAVQSQIEGCTNYSDPIDCQTSYGSIYQPQQ